MARSKVNGCRAISFSSLESKLPHFRLIINTVPALVLDAHRLGLLHPEVLVLDLASKPGGDDAACNIRKQGCYETFFS